MDARGLMASSSISVSSSSRAEAREKRGTCSGSTGSIEVLRFLPEAAPFEALGESLYAIAPPTSTTTRPITATTGEETLAKDEDGDEAEEAPLEPSSRRRPLLEDDDDETGALGVVEAS